MDHYADLGLGRDATELEIKKAYRKLCLVHHPDKQASTSDKPADATEFHKIQTAYETLSDPAKKATYDYKLKGPGGASGSREYTRRSYPFSFPSNSGATFRGSTRDGDSDSGDEAFGDFGPDPFIFNLFGRSRARAQYSPAGTRSAGFGPPPHKQKTATSKVKVHVTLEDLYNRKKKRVSVTRTRPCEPCNGSGGKAGAQRRTCATCCGTGKMTTSTFHGDFLRSSFVTCTACHGQGLRYRSQDECRKCAGKRTKSQQSIVSFDATIENFSRTVVLLGEGDQDPDKEAGDIEITLKLKEPDPADAAGSTFKWVDKKDLVMPIHLTLSESLFGMDRVIVNTLDGRSLRTRLPGPAEPGWTHVQTGDKIVIPNEGLPDSSGSRGDLICEVVVNEVEKGDAIRLLDEHKKRKVFPDGREDLGGGESVTSRIKKKPRM